MARTERRWRAQRIVGETAARLRPAALRLLDAAGNDVDAHAVVRAGLSRLIDDAYQRRGIEHLGMDRQEFHLCVHDQIVRLPEDGDERIDPPVC